MPAPDFSFDSSKIKDRLFGVYSHIIYPLLTKLVRSRFIYLFIYLFNQFANKGR